MEKTFKAVSLTAIMLIIVFMLSGCIPSMNKSNKNGLTSQPRTPSKKPVRVELSTNAPKYEINIEQACVRKVSNWRTNHGLSPVKIVSHRAVKNGKIVKKIFQNTIVHKLGVLTNTVSNSLLAIGGMFLGGGEKHDKLDAIDQLKQCKREMMFDWHKHQYKEHITSNY